MVDRVYLQNAASNPPTPPPDRGALFMKGGSLFFYSFDGAPINLTTTSLSGVWPVGSVFISVVSTNPGTLLGFGTWAAFGAGKVLIGRDAGDADFLTAEQTGGAKTHTQTVPEMPNHTHVQDAHSHVEHGTNTGVVGTEGIQGSQGTGSPVQESTSPTTPTNQTTGGGNPMNIMNPYIVVYMWKRTA